MTVSIPSALFLIGLGIVGYGIWLMSHPGAIVFGGTALCVLAVFGQKPPVEPDRQSTD